MFVHNPRKDFLHFTEEFLDWQQEAFGFIQLYLGGRCKHCLALRSKGNSPAKEWSNGPAVFHLQFYFQYNLTSQTSAYSWVEEPSADWNAGGRSSRKCRPYWLHPYWSFCIAGMGVSSSCAVPCCWTGSLEDHEWRRITEELYRDLF